MRRLCLVGSCCLVRIAFGPGSGMRLINVSKVCLNAPLVMACIREHGAEAMQKTAFFQVEHNLVLPGGRGLEADDPQGVVPSMYGTGQRYHVRVVRKAWYRKADIIVEYNVPNIENIRTSGIFPESITRKIIYGPSLPWPYQPVQPRELAIISNMNPEDEPRRLEMMTRLEKTCPTYQNIQGSYEWEDVQRLYARTGILVNFHRTWHHHSIEEFRILPALLQGCVVISEDVPLRKSIPYHEHVIWCGYDELPSVARDVLDHHADYYHRVHGDGRLARLVDGMVEEFRRAFHALL